MSKRILIFIGLCAFLLTLTACSPKDNVAFKKDYEALNGKTNSNGKEYRTVTIAKNNPIIISNAKEIVDKIANGDNFYVYFGSSLCPWCRSVIEKAIEIANANEISKVYYVDIWDKEGNEILRDKYTLDDSGNAVLLNEGTVEYTKLLTYFEDILPDYTYAANKNGGALLNVAEKRIYIPLFVYIAGGKVVRSTSGISDLQTNSREELNLEMLIDEENLFNDFFINVCDENC